MYKIQNRYQDSGWMDLDRGDLSAGNACSMAFELSKDSIAFGMTRVINTETGEVLVEYPAGGVSGSFHELSLPPPPEINGYSPAPEPTQPTTEEVRAQGLLDMFSMFDKQTVGRFQDIISALSVDKIKTIMDMIHVDDDGFVVIKFKLGLMP